MARKWRKPTEAAPPECCKDGLVLYEWRAVESDERKREIYAAACEHERAKIDAFRAEWREDFGTEYPHGRTMEE